MTGIDLTQVKSQLVRPVLGLFENPKWASESSVVLLVGTGLVESGYAYVTQLDRGPAASFWQMEKATHDDIWANWLSSKAMVAEATLIKRLMSPQFSGWDQIKWNLAYAITMVRMHYARAKPELPAPSDALGMAKYHKDNYNTRLGAANPTYNQTLFQKAIQA